MTDDLCERVIAQIASGEFGFNMRDWCSVDEPHRLSGVAPKCGTTLCIAGHICVAAGARVSVAQDDTDPSIWLAANDKFIDEPNFARQAWRDAYPDGRLESLDDSFLPSHWLDLGFPDGQPTLSAITAHLRRCTGKPEYQEAP